MGGRPQGVVTHQPSQPSTAQTTTGSDDWIAELIVSLLSLVWWMVKTAVQLAWRFPLVAAVLVVVWWAYTRDRLLPVGIVVVVLVLVLVVWRFAWPVSFNRLLAQPAWRRRKRRAIRRNWPGLCERVGLAMAVTDRRSGRRESWTPGLSRLRWASREHLVLTGRVHVVAGQTVDDLATAAETLGAACGAWSCRVRKTGPRTAVVTWLYGDPLAQVVTPLPIPQVLDASAVPVGLREDGQPWLLRLAATHVLIVGVTGAGKGSVVWSLLGGIAVGIRDGLVQVWAVDGKAGMELQPGRDLFTRFATTVEDGVQLLEDAAVLMTERAARMAGTSRRHEPSTREPLLVVLVDEVALLTAYTPDRKLRDRAEKALAAIATQGRAPGVVLVAALQDPRKEVLGLRNLFPTKIAMRLDEKSQVDMVLGEGARESGALCHQISDTAPGVAYVKVDGVREPVRVRAAYYDDQAITDLARTHAPSTRSRSRPVFSVVDEPQSEPDDHARQAGAA
ncbi:FtsK/SpoIIIE domain-containing protein [Kineococcus endophyticus]|uniref:FtsK/SpoIIIE domain-containing protein n=1 Tax=Kineococcus endophyticus TaxID=1181883 RepID=A0ABV3P3U5_9ACTN